MAVPALADELDPFTREVESIPDLPDPVVHLAEQLGPKARLPVASVRLGCWSGASFHLWYALSTQQTTKKIR
jgi:hypothetical protein